MLNIAELDKKIIYLDHAATTPIDDEVYDVMDSVSKKHFANSSAIYSLGRDSKQCIEIYRKKASDVLSVSPDEIIFTGSGTESDNLAIKGIAKAHRARGKHIIISGVEHKAVLCAAKDLEKEGFEITIAPVDRHGLLKTDFLIKAIRTDTILVSVIYAQNEIGTVQDINTLASHIKGQKDIYPIFHIDACQAVGYLPIKPNELHVDLMTINSSKIYGPKGIGMLYKKKSIKIAPIIVGGDQEYGLRAGTENVALIAGFVTALEKSEQLRGKSVLHFKKMQKDFIENIKCRIPHAILNGHPTKRLPNNVHISIPYIEGESALLLLEKEGILCSTGSACSSRSLEPSHVLIAIGQDQEIIHGSLRFSFGRETTYDDLEFTLQALEKIVNHLLSLSALTSKIYEGKR